MQQALHDLKYPLICYGIDWFGQSVRYFGILPIVCNAILGYNYIDFVNKFDIITFNSNNIMDIFTKY